MAWIDERVWCHPKLVDVSDRAFRVWVHGIAYASGYGTGGLLTPGAQKVLGATQKVREELEQAGLWEPNGVGVYIHDWKEHNGKRDERRIADRERKRAARASQRQSS